jgi:hypothetical protein
LEDDFSVLKDRLSQYSIYYEIRDLVEKIEGDIKEIKKTETNKIKKSSRRYHKALVTYETFDGITEQETLKFESEFNNPIINIASEKILHKVQFFVQTQNFKKSKSKSIRKAAKNIISVEMLETNEKQSNLGKYS